MNNHFKRNENVKKLLAALTACTVGGTALLAAAREQFMTATFRDLVASEVEGVELTGETEGDPIPEAAGGSAIRAEWIPIPFWPWGI